MTMGSEGSETWTRAEHARICGHRVSIVDTTGAGDTFNSSFVYCMTQGMDIFRAAAFSNMAAADSVTRVGPKSGVGSADRIWKMLEGK